MTSVSAGHIIQTPTQPVGSGRPQRESNPGPPHQESRALPQSYRALRDWDRKRGREEGEGCVFTMGVSLHQNHYFFSIASRDLVCIENHNAHFYMMEIILMLRILYVLLYVENYDAKLTNSVSFSTFCPYYLCMYPPANIPIFYLYVFLTLPLVYLCGSFSP